MNHMIKPNINTRGWEMMGREMFVELNSGTCLVNAGPRLEKKTSVSPRCDISTQTITTPLIHIDHLSASWFKRGRERESVKDRQRQWRYKKQYASHLLNTGWLSYSASSSFFYEFWLLSSIVNCWFNVCRASLLNIITYPVSGYIQTVFVSSQYSHSIPLEFNYAILEQVPHWTEIYSRSFKKHKKKR